MRCASCIVDALFAMEFVGSPSAESLQDDVPSMPSSPSLEEASLMPAQSNQPFTPEVVAVLQSLYRRGMTGWGKRHSLDIESAVASTGLQLSQVKVCYCGINKTISCENFFLVELDPKTEYEENGSRYKVRSFTPG